MMYLLGVILILVTGLMNRLRGGALNDYLAERGINRVSHTITRLMLALFATISFYVPICYSTGVNVFGSGISSFVTFFTFLSIYVIGIIPGWGTYFDLGNTKRDYVDHREVLWIDWVLYKIFGAIWIPKNIGCKTQFEKENNLHIQRGAFDIIDSPTGEGRCKSWRQVRDFTGLSLRGLHFYVPSCLIIYAQFKYLFDISFIKVLCVIPFGLLFGAIYQISTKLNFRNLFKKIGLKKYYKYFQGYTQKGEFFTGAILLSGIPYFIFLN